jgi:hypothetical protein
MFAASRTARRRGVRPVCAALEGRALLSFMTVHPMEVRARAAEFDFSGQNHGFHGPIVPKLPATPNASISTVPASGDVNPYGVAFVPEDFPRGGLLHPGDVLVSNFNNSNNVQGTGTTIVRIQPGTGKQSLFFTSQEPGLSTALGVLQGGFVLAGNAPTPDGTLAHMGPGSLQVIDRFGHQVLNITDPKLLQGVWDLTVNDFGPFAQVFVSNALTGAVTRIDLLVLTAQDTVHVLDMTQVASGYAHPANSGAVVLAPTGLAFDAQTDTLYVASTGDNAIYAVANAALTHNGSGKGTVIFNDPTILNGPLGLALAANGDLLTTNGDAFNPNFTGPPSALIEISPAGHFVGQLSLDPSAGSAFGLATTFDDGTLTVATVNDDSNKNTLDLRTITQH